jgi:cell pole-organizing protein PopZ
MTQPAKSHEPSMEEILASIRRIIADDDAKPAAAPQPAFVAPPLMEMPRPAPMAQPVMPEPAMAAPVMPEPAMPEPMELPPVALVRDIEPVFAPPPAPPEADILDLTEEMRAPDPAPDFRTIKAEPDVMFAEPEPELVSQFGEQPEPVLEQPAPMMADPLEAARQTLTEQMDRPLLSHAASVAVDSAFTSLAHTVLTQNARTLDDLVKDMLRPMLKAWLDDNLPSLVERLVRAEIERVSRGR